MIKLRQGSNFWLNSNNTNANTSSGGRLLEKADSISYHADQLPAQAIHVAFFM